MPKPINADFREFRATLLKKCDKRAVQMDLSRLNLSQFVQYDRPILGRHCPMTLNTWRAVCSEILVSP